MYCICVCMYACVATGPVHLLRLLPQPVPAADQHEPRQCGRASPTADGLHQPREEVSLRTLQVLLG